MLTEYRKQVFTNIVCLLQSTRVSCLDSVFLLVDQSLKCQFNLSHLDQATYSTNLLSHSSTLEDLPSPLRRLLISYVSLCQEQTHQISERLDECLSDRK